MQAVGYNDLYIQRKISLNLHQSLQRLGNSSFNSFGHITWEESSGVQYAICWGSNSESLTQKESFQRKEGSHPSLCCWEGSGLCSAAAVCAQPGQGQDSALRCTGHGCRVHSPGKICLATLVELLYNLNKVCLFKSTNVHIESEGRAWKSESCVIGFCMSSSMNTWSPLVIISEALKSNGSVLRMTWSQTQDIASNVKFKWW